jgi:hypothetical protein
MTMQNPAHRDPLWLRVLNTTLKGVIAAQVTLLLFVGVVVLGIVVGIIGVAMNR